MYLWLWTQWLLPPKSAVVHDWWAIGEHSATMRYDYPIWGFTEASISLHTPYVRSRRNYREEFFSLLKFHSQCKAAPFLFAIMFSEEEIFILKIGKKSALPCKATHRYEMIHFSKALVDFITSDIEQLLKHPSAFSYTGQELEFDTSRKSDMCGSVFCAAVI